MRLQQPHRRTWVFVRFSVHLFRFCRPDTLRPDNPYDGTSRNANTAANGGNALPADDYVVQMIGFDLSLIHI